MKNYKNVGLAALFVIAAFVLITNTNILSSLAMSLNAGGTNENLYLNPTGNGHVAVGGDSIVVASRSSDPTAGHVGQIYFNTSTNKFVGFDGTAWRTFKFDFTPVNINSIHLGSSLSRYLSIADGIQTGLDITGDWSMAVWIKLDSQPATDAAYVIQDKREGDTNGESMRYSDDGGTKRLYARFKNGSSTTEGYANITLPTGVWTHIVFAVSIQTPQIYIWVNNVAKSVVMPDTAATAITDSAAAFAFGSQPNGGAYFDGFLDEAFVYSRRLTSSDVGHLYNRDGNYEELTSTDSDLRGGWKFDNNLSDVSGHGNTLTNNNGAVFSADIPWQ